MSFLSTLGSLQMQTDELRLLIAKRHPSSASNPAR